MKILYIFMGIAVVYIVFKYVIRLIAPFIIAWLLASLLNPFVTWMKKTLRVPRGFGTIFSMITILSAIVSLLGLLIQQLWQQAIAFKNAFPIYQEQIMEFIAIVEDKFSFIADRIPLPDAFTTLDGVIKQLLDYISQFLGTILKHTYDVVSTVPNGVFFLIITLIATFFMTKDYHMIKAFVKAQVPLKVADKIVLMQKGLKNALGGYVKTQLILMCYTFAICLVGLFILQREYVLLLSLGIAVFDAVPAFGSGAILIPWGIYYLIIGEYGIGIGLVCVYGLILIMRQVMEPKVLSSQIGVYALVTVIAMYVGLQTMGVLGIIIGPVTVVIIQTLQRVGVIPDFKKPPHTKE